MTIADVPILDVWVGLGGGPLRGGRGQAFWRDGDGYSVAVDVRKNVWFDFRDSRGGGPLTLVEVGLSCSRGEALKWLGSRYGMFRSRPLTPYERARRKEASDLAQRLSDFHHGLTLLADQPALARMHSLNRGTVLEWRRHATTPVTVFDLWNRCPCRELIAEIGSDDRLHAEGVASIIVELLAVAQGKTLA